MKNTSISILCVLIVMITVSGCGGVSQSVYDKLETDFNKLKNDYFRLENKNNDLEIENNDLEIDKEVLKTELDEYRYGAERLVAEVNKAYDEKNYSSARHNISLLNSKHPESLYNKKFKKLLKNIEKKEIEEEKINKAKEQERERVRLENLKKTGMWGIKYYVDKFGEPTKKGYISNKNIFTGIFKNSVSDNSIMGAWLLISNESNISIIIYEYGNLIIRGDQEHKIFEFRILDKYENKINIFADNNSDRFVFNKENSRKLHNVLMKGGKLKFFIRDTNLFGRHRFNAYHNNYLFVIENADFYGNAYKILMDK